jgi:hypothetical protein
MIDFKEKARKFHSKQLGISARWFLFCDFAHDVTRPSKVSKLEAAYM